MGPKRRLRRKKQGDPLTQKIRLHSLSLSLPTTTSIPQPLSNYLPNNQELQLGNQVQKLVRPIRNHSINIIEGAKIPRNSLERISGTDAPPVSLSLSLSLAPIPNGITYFIALLQFSQSSLEMILV